METINRLELTDPERYPDDEVLKAVLGVSFGAYQELIALFGRNGMTHEWRYYRDGKAWLCKVQKKKRTIVWMSAWKGYMQASMYFPGKYIDDVCGLDIGEATIAKFKATKNTGTSRACIFEIRDADILADFDKVMQFKIIAK
jgi:hypothetical protein